MNIFDIILTGIALSMDAFTVSICKGLAMSKDNKRKQIIISLYFGLFQIMMPIIGFLFASIFHDSIQKMDHWISLILLGTIGSMMIIDAFSKGERQETDQINILTMLPLSIATSIDALAVGVTFSFLNVSIIKASIIIGLITTFLSYQGVRIGFLFGKKKEKESKILGGVILILLGLKILMEHTGIINVIIR